MDLHVRIRAARVAVGLSQSEAASAIGVQPHTVYRYERQGLTPSIDLLAKLAALYRVSIDWLVTGSEHVARATEPALAPTGTEG